MKRLLPLLFIFLAACTTNVCTDDGACSSSELLRGGCADCKPDFTVSNLEASYQGDELYVYYCVENINGQYEGPLSVNVGMSGQETIYAQNEQEINFRSSVMDVNAWVFPNEGGTDYTFNIREGDRDEMWCSSERFETPNSQRFQAWVDVDSDRQVDERDDENNYDYVFVETDFVESYPEYLIENDIGEYTYQSSRRQFSGDWTRFIARYYSPTHGTYVQVDNHQWNWADESLLESNVTIEDVTMPVTLYVDSHDSGDNYVHFVYWESANYTVSTAVDSESAEISSVLNDDLVREYLLKYPSHDVAESEAGSFSYR